MFCLYGNPGYPEGIPNREFFGTFVPMNRPVDKMCIRDRAYMAQTERKKIRERQRQGIEIAKANGKYRGTRPAYAADAPNPQKRFIYRCIVNQLKNKAAGAPISYRAIAAETGVSAQTVINIKNRLV